MTENIDVGGLHSTFELDAGDSLLQLIKQVRQLGEVGQEANASLTVSARNQEAAYNKLHEQIREEYNGIEALRTQLMQLGPEGVVAAEKIASALGVLEKDAKNLGASLRLTVSPEGVVGIQKLALAWTGAKDATGAAAAQVKVLLDNTKTGAKESQVTVEQLAAAESKLSQEYKLSAEQLDLVRSRLAEIAGQRSAITEMAGLWNTTEGELKKVLASLGLVGSESQKAGEQGKSTWQKMQEGASSFVKEADKAGFSLKKITTELTSLATKKGVLAAGAGGLLSGLTGTLAQLGSALPGPAGAIGGLFAIPAGLFAELEHITAGVESYSASIKRNADFLGLNKEMGQEQYSTIQALDRAFTTIGGTSDQLTQVLDRFQRNVATGGTQLKALGMTLADVGITSTDLGTSLLEVNKFLLGNADAAIKDAVGLELFGRQGKALSQLLTEIDIPKYTKALEQFGVVLSADDIKAGAVAQSIRQGLGVALDGLKNQVGVQLEGAFAMLEIGIINAMGGGQAAVQNAAKAIAWVVGAVLSFIEGLFGVDTKMSDITKQFIESIDAINNVSNTAADAQAQNDATATAASNNTAAQIKALRELAKTQADGLADQIDTLTKATKLQTDGIQDQIDAENAKSKAVQDTIADQKNQQKLQDDAGTSYLAILQAQLDLMQSAQESFRHSGESMATYLRRLYEQDLKDKIAAENKKRKTQDDTNASTIASVQDETAKKVAALQKAKDLLAEGTAATIDALNKQKDKINETAQAEEAAMQANLDASKAANQAKLADTVKNLNLTGDDLTKALKDWTLKSNQGAHDFGEAFRKGVQAAVGWIKEMWQHPDELAPQAAHFGLVIAAAFVHGMYDGMVAAFNNIDWGAIVKDHPWLMMTPMGPMLLGMAADQKIGDFLGLTSHAGANISNQILALAGTGNAGGYNIPTPTFSTTGGGGFGGVGKTIGRGSALGGPLGKDVYMLGERGVELLDMRGGVPNIIPNANIGVSGVGSGTMGGEQSMHLNFYGNVTDDYVAGSMVRNAQREFRRRGLGNRSVMGA